jgi:ABC-type phosphate transport system substrate-binding protein
MIVAGALKISGSSALFSLVNPVAQNYQRLCSGTTINIISVVFAGENSYNLKKEATPEMGPAKRVGTLDLKNSPACW